MTYRGNWLKKSFFFVSEKHFAKIIIFLKMFSSSGLFIVTTLKPQKVCIQYRPSVTLPFVRQFSLITSQFTTIEQDIQIHCLFLLVPSAERCHQLLQNAIFSYNFDEIDFLRSLCEIVDCWLASQQQVSRTAIACLLQKRGINLIYVTGLITTQCRHFYFNSFLVATSERLDSEQRRPLLYRKGIWIY